MADFVQQPGPLTKALPKRHYPDESVCCCVLRVRWTWRSWRRVPHWRCATCWASCRSKVSTALQHALSKPFRDGLSSIVCTAQAQPSYHNEPHARVKLLTMALLGGTVHADCNKHICLQRLALCCTLPPSPPAQATSWTPWQSAPRVTLMWCAGCL